MFCLFCLTNSLRLNTLFHKFSVLMEERLDQKENWITILYCCEINVVPSCTHVNIQQQSKHTLDRITTPNMMFSNWPKQMCVLWGGVQYQNSLLWESCWILYMWNMDLTIPTVYNSYPFVKYIFELFFFLLFRENWKKVKPTKIKERRRASQIKKAGKAA